MTIDRHWNTRVDAAGIAWLTLDTRGVAVNILTREVMAELESVLASLSTERLTGLVFTSGKPSGFIAGADISEFSRISSEDEGTRLALQGQALFARIEDLSIPTVAAMNGAALGGGLELALACDYRVVAARPDRCLGLPEVQLGIHPGFGGTVRSVKLLGAPAALDLMLTGKQLTPEGALKLGLVDRLVAPADLEKTAADLISRRPPRRRPPWQLRALDRWPLRRFVVSRARAALRKRVREDHYPAPFALLELYARHGAHGPDAYREEAQSIGRLVRTPTCANLVRVFFLRERLRNLADKDLAAKRIHVVGAGVMGGDIASWCAANGLQVSLQDQSPEIVDRALNRAAELFARQSADEAQRRQMQQRISADIDGMQITEADIVVEAIVERLDAKQALFRAIEPRLKPGAILATNTSSIVLESMSDVLERPDRLVGLHFFNPVARLPLVEVVRGAATSDATMERALAFVVQIAKLPLPCRSAPGFLVNRILMPYMLEALRANEDGHSPETIDAAAMNFGMPLGPIELADRVGLDVAKHVVSVLLPEQGDDMPPRLAAKVEAGELGVKTGVGFYRYQNDRPAKASDYPEPSQDLEDRLILPMVNEAVACLADRIVDDADLVDAGVIFGTGFAPFRGGPLQYARHRGAAAIITRLRDLERQFGPRFSPHPGWQRLSL